MMPDQMKLFITDEEMKQEIDRLQARRQTTILPRRIIPDVKIDESLFERDPLNVLHFTAEIKTQCQETYDEFIFKQIKPFCENAVRMVISKKLLVRALTEYFENHPEEREPKEGVNEDV